ncbi:MAG: hypothetical protein HYZ20_14005 [Burkholderiales bacterium]|nr:hypothetical protein [Burkholderiales bacterium]
MLLLAACAGPGLSRLEPGLDEPAVLARWGEPTGRHALPGGGIRLEYATGPYGLQTWMVDLDTAGRVTQARQVLEYGALTALQGELPGMTREELLRTLGRPGEVRSGGRQGGQVWSWRFFSPFCLWFQVGVGDDGRVVDAVFSPDPACDALDDDRM